MFSRRLVQLSTDDVKEQYQIVAPATMTENLFLLTSTFYKVLAEGRGSSIQSAYSTTSDRKNFLMSFANSSGCSIEAK